MADVKFTPQFDDSQIIAGLEALAARVDDLEVASKQLGESTQNAFDEAYKGVEAMNKELSDGVRNLDVNKVKLKDFSRVAERSKSVFRRFSDQIELFGVSLSDVVDGLKGFGRQSESSAKKVSLLGKAFSFLGKGAIGLVITALTGLVAFLKRTQKGAELLEQATAGLTAGFNVLVGRAAKLGEALVTLFDDPRRAAELAGEAFAGVTDEIIKQTQAAVNLQKIQQELNEELRKSELSEKRVIANAEERKRIAEDTTKLEKERIEAFETNIRAFDQLLRQRIITQDKFIKNLETQRDQLKADGLDTREINQQIDEQLTRRAEIREDLTARILEQENALRSLQEESSRARLQAIEEERKRVQDLTKEYARLINALNDSAAQIRFDQLTPFEQLEEEREKAIAEVDRLKQAIQDKANELGRDLPPTFEQNIELLYSEINRAFIEEAQKLNGQLEQLSIIPPGLEKQSREDAERVVQETFNAITLEIEKQRPTLDALYNDILDGLGISEEQADVIFSQAGLVFDSLNAIRDANLQLEFNRIDALIRKRQDSVSQLERQLAEEQKLRDDGNANDVAGVQARLEKETRILEQEQAKRFELERKAANRQLVVDSLLTSSQIILASAKLSAAEAGKGIIGIVTALSGLALLTSIIARAKSNATELSAPEQLRKGKKLEGPSHENGGIPLNVEGRWYEAEGGEYLIGTAPSKEHDQFLANLNARKYDNMPLLEMAENAHRNRFMSTVRETMAESKRFKESQVKDRYRQMERVIREEVGALGDRVVEELKKHPQYYEKDGELYRRWSNGDKDKIV